MGPMQPGANRRSANAARSPTIIAGALVLPETRLGMIETSATRRD